MRMEMEIPPRCRGTTMKQGEGEGEGEGERVRSESRRRYYSNMTADPNKSNIENCTSSSTTSDAAEKSNSKSKSSSSNTNGKPVGLRILIHRCQRESNIVNKFMFMNQTSPPTSRLLSSFLKACHLCKKQLSPNKDVYMYRGDQGFCSVECRCRQMLMDEWEEREDRYLRERSRRRLQSSSTPQCRRGNRIKESSRPAKGIPAMA